MSRDPALTPEDVRAYCAERIAHFKIPAHVAMREALPMTVTGKPQKFIMRERQMEELGLSATP